MIFVTVGMQMPFDRLCQAIDQWAGESGRDDVFMQIGATDWRPSHVPFTTKVAPDEFNARISEADLLVMHAGIGSIVSAVECGKPILVMPRRMKFRETRNDHQVATANRLSGMESIQVAMDEDELILKLKQFKAVTQPDPIEAHAAPELIERIRSFIHQ